MLCILGWIGLSHRKDHAMPLVLELLNFTIHLNAIILGTLTTKVVLVDTGNVIK